MSGSVVAKNRSLYKLRVDRRWSQMTVAATAKIPISTYQLIEQGKNEGKPSTWLKLQKLYGIPDEEMWKIIKQSI